MLTKTKTSEEIKVFQNEHCWFFFLHYTHSSALIFSYFTEKTVLKRERASRKSKEVQSARFTKMETEAI